MSSPTPWTVSVAQVLVRIAAVTDLVQRVLDGPLLQL